MSNEERREQVREEIRQRAMTVKDNPVDPDHPTALGLLVALSDEIAALRVRVEDLEAQREA